MDTAYSAPHSYASLYDQRILVMIDEFQNLSEYIYRDKTCTDAKDTRFPGAYHEHSESKVAPMLVTGSAVNVIDTELEAGRLHKRWFSPYLSPDEGLEAVYLPPFGTEQNRVTGAGPLGCAQLPLRQLQHLGPGSP